MKGNFKVLVIDKDTNKLAWYEFHPTLEKSKQAIKELEERNYNPNHFIFKIEEVAN